MNTTVEIYYPKGHVVLMDVDAFVGIYQAAKVKYNTWRHRKRIAPVLFDPWSIQPFSTRSYLAKRGRKTMELFHRLLTAAKAGFEVDHINGQSLDNRGENLRVCSHQENNCNKHKRSLSATSSRYKGVYLYKRTGKWIARVTVMYKMIHIGTFNTEQEAAEAYDKAALKQHGKFALLNFPTK